MKRRAPPKEAPTETKRAKLETSEPTRKVPARAAKKSEPAKPLATKAAAKPKATPAPKKAVAPKAAPKKTAVPKKIAPKKILTKTKALPTKKGKSEPKLSPTHSSTNPFARRRKWDEVDVLQSTLQIVKKDFEDGEKKDLDAVLVGADNPEYKKTQQYKTVMDQIAKGDYSNPIIKEIMKEPIPEDLQGLPAAAVFKGRLRERQQEEQLDANYVENMRKLSLLAGLPLICDIIWSYFSERKKSILLRETLESHTLAVHNTPLKKGTLTESIDMILALGGKWCTQKEINQKQWITIEKDSALYESTKKLIETKHHELKTTTFLKY